MPLVPKHFSLTEQMADIIAPHLLTGYATDYTLYIYCLNIIYGILFFPIQAIERRRTMLRERARQKEAEKVLPH